MNTFKTLLLLLLTGFLFSCGTNNSSKKTEETEKESPKVAENTIKIATESAIMKWTAYKFKEKAGVGGSFDTLNIDSKTDNGTPEQILLGGSISIPTSSVNSNNEIRDPKIKKSFFGTFNTPEIKGKILSAADGKGEIEFSMNGLSVNVPYTYNVNDAALRIKTSLDVTNWNGGAAIAALNKVCEALHTGEDGTSVLWPDVDVTLTFPLVN